MRSVTARVFEELKKLGCEPDIVTDIWVHNFTFKGVKFYLIERDHDDSLKCGASQIRCKYETGQYWIIGTPEIGIGKQRDPKTIANNIMRRMVVPSINTYQSVTLPKIEAHYKEHETRLALAEKVEALVDVDLKNNFKDMVTIKNTLVSIEITYDNSIRLSLNSVNLEQFKEIIKVLNV